ncbi:hypothetical protein [Halorientalis salina]|uniref:hypothetical protein n=1 Tax=Halorientalis salina TaxID=2932266 RepID=UPI0010AD08BB|nr:hypothetical protein [Halorientalis salina]
MVDESGKLYSENIEYPGGSITTDGYMTQNGMEAHQGSSADIYHQGVISGKQNASIKGGGAWWTQDSTCVKFYGSGVKLGVPDYVRQGDSGGPFWHEQNGNNYIITVLSGMEVQGDYSGSCATGKKGRPAYGYPFWRVANNTSYTI